MSFEFSADVCEYDSVRAMGLNFHGLTISVNLSDPTFFIYEKKKSGSKIKEELRKYLPNYMIPKKIKFIENIPTTNNCKIDRKALGKLEI